MKQLAKIFGYMVAIPIVPFVVISVLYKTMKKTIEEKLETATVKNRKKPAAPDGLKLLLLGTGGLTTTILKRGTGLELYSPTSEEGLTDKDFPIFRLEYDKSEENTLRLIFNHTTIHRMSKK